MADKEQLVQEVLQRLEDSDRQIRQQVLSEFFEKAIGSAGQPPSPPAVPKDDTPKSDGSKLTQADVDLAVHQALESAKAEYEKQIEELELDEEGDMKERFDRVLKRAKAAQGAQSGEPSEQPSGGEDDGSGNGEEAAKDDGSGDSEDASPSDSPDSDK